MVGNILRRNPPCFGTIQCVLVRGRSLVETVIERKGEVGGLCSWRPGNPFSEDQKEDGRVVAVWDDEFR